MAKQKKSFTCQNCGTQHSKWMGRCTECGAWNQINEETIKAGPGKKTARAVAESSQPLPISEVGTENIARINSGMEELDNVLGGGAVPGSVVLVGGEPGVGKSTLLLQAASAYASQKNHRVLYVTGEESASQIALRAKRLKISESDLFVVAETSLEQVLEHISKLKPQVIILDSVQTAWSNDVDSQPGTVSQIRECAYKLIEHAKYTGTACFLVGHVTKEGAIAGPKLLEHMVDVVLYFDSAANHNFRMLRTIKNRYGSTSEIGVFEMTSQGMQELKNPSELFLSDTDQAVPGTAVVASMEGNRPILVEVQALASNSSLAMPRRTAIGIDPQRLSLLVAILEKRAGYRFSDQDVYVNLVGGLKLLEPAIDLGLVHAILSSLTGKALPKDAVFFGELGLGGEIRSVPRIDARAKEATRLGFKKVFFPERQKEDLKPFEDVEKVPLGHVSQLSDFL